MKKLNNIIVILLIIFGSTSCSDYLDVVPDNIATIDFAFRNQYTAESYLFTCYSYLPPIGAVNYDPAMNGCDETWMLYGEFDFPNSQIQRGFQNPNNPVLNFWDGERSGKPLFQGIRDCNIFLENIDHVIDLPEYQKRRWIAEVKFLKAYYHWYLLKTYGPIPIIDKNLPISAGVDEVKIYREPVDDVVKYITDLMLEAASDLPSPSEVVEGTEAGRIDKLIALSMRGKVLLFAASPLFNGNSDYAHMVDDRGVQLFSQEYNQEKWILASNALKDAIDYAHAEGKNLYDLVDPLVVGAPEPLQVQTTFREAITSRWNKELIWGGTNYDCNFLANHSEARIINREIEYVRYTRSDWSPTMKMVEKFYSSNGVPIDEDLQWQRQGWYNNRFEVRPEPSVGDEKFFIKEDEKTVYLHFNREPRFYATVGFDKGIYFGGGYYNFPENVKYTNFFQGGHSGRTGVANFAIAGYSAKKMHSFKNAQTTNAHSIEYFPFPILRLSDLYLMYAEAFNEANGPSDEVYFYLDLIRARVGLAGIKHAWSNHSILPNKPDTKEGLREIIHQERTIELMLEGKRYWDIRRWKKINELNIPPKGWNSEGENHDDFYNVIVVARDPVNFGVKDYFAPIKENNLIINPNLIQNFGW